VNSPIRRPLIGVAIACVVALVAATPFTTRRAGADGGPGARSAAHAACDPGNGGLSLPDGFCATIFADNLGGVRHITVTPKGDVIVALESSGKNPNARGTGALILRDTSGKGKADVQRLIPAPAGTGIAWRDGWLYLDEQSRITRYKLPAGALDPAGTAETIVEDLPTGGHGARNIAFDRDGALYVNIGSRTNACQERDRQNESRGNDPCTELDTRAGVWRFDAATQGQKPTKEHRYVTGIRNAMGLALNQADGHLYATQHGRDQLYQNWPKLYDEKQGAEKPAEEFVELDRGRDFGWPYCYYDQDLKRLVMAPEYGGDAKSPGRCASKTPPVTAFPGHWAPMSLVFYNGTAFPQRYRGGAFIAFHGSWNRAPLPQQGYRVVFIPAPNGKPGSAWETFAIGFNPRAPTEPLAGGSATPVSLGSGDAHWSGELYRPCGLAVGPDGALYIGDDTQGRIWRVVPSK